MLTLNTLVLIQGRPTFNSSKLKQHFNQKNYGHRIYDSDKVSHNLNKFNAKMRTLDICLEM